MDSKSSKNSKNSQGSQNIEPTEKDLENLSECIQKLLQATRKSRETSSLNSEIKDNRKKIELSKQKSKEDLFLDISLDK